MFKKFGEKSLMDRAGMMTCVKELEKKKSWRVGWVT